MDSDPLLPTTMGRVSPGDRDGPAPHAHPSPSSPPAHRQWDGPLLACCGRDPCDPADCGACGVVACMPCGLAVLHGRTTERLLGRHPRAWWAARPGLTLAALTLLPWLARTPLVLRTEAGCYPLDVHAPGIPAGLAAACARGRAAEAATWWAAAALTAAGLGLAAARRVAARARHGVAGGLPAGRAGAALTVAGDVAAWLCCPACAACQEARTAAAGRCEGGVWGGGSGSGVGDAEAPPAGAPAFTRG